MTLNNFEAMESDRIDKRNTICLPDSTIALSRLTKGDFLYNLNFYSSSSSEFFLDTTTVSL